MSQLFTRARAEAWRAAQPKHPALPALAAAARTAETACLLGLSLLLALAIHYR